MTANKKDEIVLSALNNGMLWPHYKNNKALSASKLTHFIKSIEYGEIPDYIMQAAAKRGKIFHKAIQDYFQYGLFPSFFNENSGKNQKLSNVEKRIYETINFLKKNNLLQHSNYIQSEELHYTLYRKELIAAYSDISFVDYIIELKTSNIKAKESPLLLLIFEIQLLIQHLCTEKDIYLLWSTGEGIIFNKFKKTKELLKILDILINVVRQKKEFSKEEKEKLVKKILTFYRPNTTFFLTK